MLFYYPTVTRRIIRPGADGRLRHSPRQDPSRSGRSVTRVHRQPAFTLNARVPVPSSRPLGLPAARFATASAIFLSCREDRKRAGCASRLRGSPKPPYAAIKPYELVPHPRRACLLRAAVPGFKAGGSGRRRVPCTAAEPNRRCTFMVQKLNSILPNGVRMLHSPSKENAGHLKCRTVYASAHPTGNST